jgi:heptosyltransferase II
MKSSPLLKRNRCSPLQNGCAAGFDAAILLPNSFRSAAEAWLAAIPRRVGFRGHFRSTLLTQIIDEPQKKKAAPPKHHADRYWHMAKTCGANPPPSTSVHHSARSESVPLEVCPGAEYGPAKRWPADRFRKTMELVPREIVCSWVIVGTQSDGRVAAEILDGFHGNAEDLTGKTSLAGLIEQLLKCGPSSRTTPAQCISPTALAFRWWRSSARLNRA